MHSVVAPLAGAWIEIHKTGEYFYASPVAPLAGAWIEMAGGKRQMCFMKSLPLRERGLKWT